MRLDANVRELARPLSGRLHRLIRPQVAAADTRPGDADYGIGGQHNGGVRNVFDSDIAGGMHDGCAHNIYRSVIWLLARALTLGEINS